MLSGTKKGWPCRHAHQPQGPPWEGKETEKAKLSDGASPKSGAMKSCHGRDRPFRATGRDFRGRKVLGGRNNQILGNL